ncbi:phosphotransferase family protein [Halioxenophilus aromaticivorans]|uniref:Phosphotransferase family protein n=1 Tax=Halioxenophilus aromaticivorans TaxID=1306992 RepID=A0AAV3U288_9ALTE
MAEDPPQNLDLKLLQQELEANVEGFSGLLTAKKFPGGQSNPTYLLTANNQQYVLRSQPPGKLLPSAHAVDREFKVIEALANSAVPVAQSVYFCENKAITGGLFYVMSYEQGDIFWDPALPGIPADGRADYFYELIDILAAIHSVDIEQAGLADFGKPGNYFERQLGRWCKQYRAAETEVNPSIEALIQWLQKHCPEDDGQACLVHGDYRIDNVVFYPGQAKGQAVLDWELSTIGHPMADLAYFCMCLRLPPTKHSSGLGGLDREKLHIPSEELLIQRYCQNRNKNALQHWNFYLAFSFFRLAAIVQGVYKRALQGNASNQNALQMGKLVTVLGQLAEQVID